MCTTNVSWSPWRAIWIHPNADLSTEGRILMTLLVRAATQYEHEDDADEPEDGFECELYHTKEEVENSSHVWQYFMLAIDG